MKKNSLLRQASFSVDTNIRRADCPDVRAKFPVAMAAVLYLRA
jgi:hypothetical protein